MEIKATFFYVEGLEILEDLMSLVVCRYDPFWHIHITGSRSLVKYTIDNGSTCHTTLPYMKRFMRVPWAQKVTKSMQNMRYVGKQEDQTLNIRKRKKNKKINVRHKRDEGGCGMTHESTKLVKKEGTKFE